MNGPPPNSAPKPRKPRRRWRWHVPPALVHGPEALEGAEVLDEMAGPVGVVLWQSMRDVTLWAGVGDPEERAELFQPGSEKRRLETLAEVGVDAALEAPLRTIAAMTTDPAGTGEAAMMGACRDVSDWADARGKAGTALAFATAAAVAAPANAAAAVRVGLLARRRADYARAETWFRRAIGLGRQAKDWASYAEAFLGLGNLYVQRGNFPLARRFHVRALRAARRHSMRDLQGRALHNLFGMAVESGQVKEAHEYAQGAFRAYGRSHPRLSALAHDLAYFWMTQGHFDAALDVFRALLPGVQAPAERMASLADIARAAGGAADRATFETAWDEVWRAAHGTDDQEHFAQALLDLAHGAMSLGEWARAETAAVEAREIATRRSESRVLLAAEAVLESARARQSMEAVISADPASRDGVETFAADLVRSLSTSAALR